jgi:hypothetical protein
VHAVPDSNDLKRSALDLLASGNSMQAVADMLRVPIDCVLAWEREWPKVVVSDLSTRDSVESVQKLPTHLIQRVHIEPTGFIAQRPITRAILIGLPLALGALALTANLHTTLRQLDLLRLYWLALPIGLALGGLSISYGMRSGFQLTTHAVAFRNAIGTRELAYADIDSYSVTHNPHLGVYLLNLAAKPGARSMTIWLDESQIQGGIARWCASMRCTAYTSTYHGAGPESVKKEWHDLLSCP